MVCLGKLWRPALLASALACASPVGAEAPADAHRAALALARGGDPVAALPLLEALHRRHPDRPLYLHDYLTVLVWAERPDRALELLPDVRRDRAPAYVLEAAGKAARGVGRYRLAVELYRTAVARFPDRREAVIGLGLALADAGRHAEAEEVLTGAAERWPGRAAVSNALTYARLERAEAQTMDAARERRRRAAAALRAHQAALARDPDDASALRGRILALSRLGAPARAVELARETPQVLRASDWAQILGDRGALAVGWSRQPAASGEVRRAEGERALAWLDASARRASRLGEAGEALARRTRRDRVIALRDAGRMDEAVATFESLSGTDPPIPADTLVAAGEAYLYLERAAPAREAFEQALERDRDHFEARLGLFYALADLGRIAEATDWIDRSVMYEEQRRPPDPDRRLAAISAAALARAYGERPGAAQARYEGLLAEAPYNADLRRELGNVYHWRGWPRRARDEYARVRAQEPEHLGARVGDTLALLDLRHYPAVEERVRALGERYPEARGVRRLEEDWRVHNLRELIARSAFDTRSGQQIGSRELALESHLYSAPFAHHYRAFAHGLLNAAEFDDERAYFRRAGLGLEYRGPEWRLVGEATRNSFGDVVGGFFGSAEWTPTDHWTVMAAVDTASTDVPLQARLAEIDGGSLATAVRYRWNERVDIELGGQVIDMDDNNTREAAYVTGHWLAITGPRYRLDLQPGVYASRNDREDAPYFNPIEDRAVELTLDNEWTVYQRYEESFRHGVSVTVGDYWQQGFGGGLTGALRYRHHWVFSERLALRYGVHRTRNVYDGEREYGTGGDVWLDWRF